MGGARDRGSGLSGCGAKKSATAWQAIDSPRPMLSTPSLVLPFTLTARGVDAEGGGEVGAHRLEVRQQLGPLRRSR